VVEWALPVEEIDSLIVAGRTQSGAVT
jgi:hypothetical protein